MKTEVRLFDVGIDNGDLISTLYDIHENISYKSRVFAGRNRIKVSGILFEFDLNPTKGVLLIEVQDSTPTVDDRDTVIEHVRKATETVLGTGGTRDKSSSDGGSNNSGGSDEFEKTRGRSLEEYSEEPVENFDADNVPDATTERQDRKAFRNMHKTNGDLLYVDGNETCFEPPLTKDDAKYDPYVEADREAGLPRCADCIHYIHGGACHLVKGEIDEDGTCEHGAVASVTMDNNGRARTTFISERFSASKSQVEEFVGTMVSELKDRLSSIKDSTGGLEF